MWGCGVGRGGVWGGRVGMLGLGFELAGIVNAELAGIANAGLACVADWRPGRCLTCGWLCPGG